MQGDEGLARLRLRTLSPGAVQGATLPTIDTQLGWIFAASTWLGFEGEATRYGQPVSCTLASDSG